MSTPSEQMFQRGQHWLDFAEGELSRPAEDQVIPGACQYIRNSASEFLKAYLADQSYENTDHSSLHHLQQLCGDLDPRFVKMDLSCFECRREKPGSAKNYCLSAEKAARCLGKTFEIRTLVSSKFSRKR